MIQIDDKVVSFEILEECFACDYAVCRGACCVHGDAGPPVTERECQSYQRHLSLLEPHLAPEACELIHHQGVSYTDITGERVLSVVNDENCAFTLHPTPPEGVRCAIEWYASTHPEVKLEKPISCRLYPIRVRQFKYFSSLHYDRWNICQAAVERGRKLGIKVYQFVREPLIAAFGAHFYDQLVEADKLLQEARRKEAEAERRAKR